MSATDDISDDPEDWSNLTPWVSADGRALTLEERLQHAARVIGRHNVRAFNDAARQLEEQGAPPEVLLHMLRNLADCLEKQTATMLNHIAADLMIHHAAGPFIQRSNEVH